MNSAIILTVRASHLEGAALDILKEELRFLAQPGRSLTLDLSSVLGITADAAKILLDANMRLRPRGGSLQLIGVRNSVAAYFELLRVHRQLRMSTADATPATLPVAA